MNADLLGLEESQIAFLRMCDECAAGELEILTHFEGREVEREASFKAQAEAMVRGGLLTIYGRDPGHRR